MQSFAKALERNWQAQTSPKSPRKESEVEGSFGAAIKWGHVPLVNVYETNLCWKALEAATSKTSEYDWRQKSDQRARYDRPGTGGQELRRAKRRWAPFAGAETMGKLQCLCLLGSTCAWRKRSRRLASRTVLHCCGGWRRRALQISLQAPPRPLHPQCKLHSC